MMGGCFFLGCGMFGLIYVYLAFVVGVAFVVLGVLYVSFIFVPFLHLFNVVWDRLLFRPVLYILCIGDGGDDNDDDDDDDGDGEACTIHALLYVVAENIVGKFRRELKFVLV
jgi:hypothetical protein